MVDIDDTVVEVLCDLGVVIDSLSLFSGVIVGGRCDIIGNDGNIEFMVV